MGNDSLLALVVVTALAFDFTNGFHDTGNAMATSIATGALPPRVAVALVGRAQSRRRVPVAERRRHDRQRAGRHQAGDADRRVRRAGRRHHLEPADLVLRHPVELVARADRRRRRLDAGRGRRARGEVARPVPEGDHPGRPVAGHRRAGRHDRHLPGLPDQPRRARRRPAATASGSARSARRRWSRWPTAPTTRRRRWASSRWP